MIQWVWERACTAKTATRVCIATDDARIESAAKGFGAEVVMTRAEHPSGTDRLAEVAQGDTAEIFVNVQGDEPLITGDVIDAVVAPLLADPAVLMASACRKFSADEDPHSPDVVKVVRAQNGDALYFSRSAIPFDRDGVGAAYFAHIGLYVYRREFLLGLGKLTPTPLEQAEKLEQLRVLEHGARIRMVEVAYESIGVDRPEDLSRAEARLRT
jgi:3-deoxy-manno-octulosonate cytidylyltransferase (CMP-KDO synthetase)